MGAVRHLSTNVSITVKFQIVAHVSYDYVKNFHYPCMLHKLWKKLQSLDIFKYLLKLPPIQVFSGCGEIVEIRMIKDQKGNLKVYLT